MAIFLCRRPNGDFSIVSAATKSDAVELLDEWGNAEQESLTRMPDCMFDFRLSDSGAIELADIGEATDDFIMETCYPELDQAFATAEWDESGVDYSANGRAQIRASVELEHTRLLDREYRGCYPTDQAIAPGIEVSYGSATRYALLHASSPETPARIMVRELANEQESGASR